EPFDSEPGAQQAVVPAPSRAQGPKDRATDRRRADEAGPNGPATEPGRIPDDPGRPAAGAGSIRVALGFFMTTKNKHKAPRKKAAAPSAPPGPPVRPAPPEADDLLQERVEPGDASLP